MDTKSNMDTISKDELQKQFFSIELLQWYLLNQRDLPWRRSQNPYHIWVSEIMLQQTRVDTVIPYFHRFMEKFPTLEALADAQQEEVLKAWEGLGYYSRARNLQAAVQEVKAKYGGQVPDDKTQISALKGVGPYTAGAILSIAYNKPEPAVDGNVMRVLSRYFLIEEDITKPSTRKLMEELAAELIPQGEARHFNQALMELGALVCTPKSPDCLFCPVMEQCSGRHEGVAEMLPVKKKAKPPRDEFRLVALVEGEGEHEGKVLVRQRPSVGLLASMWELPHCLAMGVYGEGSGWDAPEAKAIEYLRHHLEEESGVKVDPLFWFMDTEHVFSHIHWHMQVYQCQLETDMKDLGPEYRWVGEEEMKQLAFPNVFLRIINKWLEG